MIKFYVMLDFTTSGELCFNVIDNDNLMRYFPDEEYASRFDIDGEHWALRNCDCPEIYEGESADGGADAILFLAGDSGRGGEMAYYSGARHDNDSLKMSRKVLAIILHFARQNNLTWRLLPLTPEIAAEGE